MDRSLWAVIGGTFTLRFSTGLTGAMLAAYLAKLPGQQVDAFTVGVLALWLHKQLQATEIGHTALHGAYDKLEGGDAFRSRTFRWDVPIDEESIMKKLSGKGIFVIGS